MESHGGVILKGGKEEFGEKHIPVPLPIKNRHRLHQGANPDIRSERPPTNRKDMTLTYN
jgi:hypothetical protein